MIEQPVIRLGLRVGRDHYVDKGNILLNQAIVDKQAGKVLQGTVEIQATDKYTDSRGRQLDKIADNVFRVHVATSTLRKMTSAQPSATPKYVGEMRQVWNDSKTDVTWLRVVKEGNDIIAYDDINNSDSLHSYLCVEGTEGQLVIIAGRTRRLYTRKDGSPYKREFTMGKLTFCNLV